MVRLHLSVLFSFDLFQTLCVYDYALAYVLCFLCRRNQQGKETMAFPYFFYFANFKVGNVIIRAGEPEPRAVEPTIFSGAGARAFFNISLEPEQQKFY